MGSTDGDPPETKKDDGLSGPKKVEDEKPKDDGLSGPKKAQDEKQDEEPKDDNLAGPKKAEDEKPKDDDTKDKPPSVITVPQDKNCSILKESDVWDVESVKGNIAKKAAMSFVPGSLGKKKRRISIEVHSILPPFYEEEEGEEVKKSVVTKVKEKVMEKIKGKKEPEKPPEVPRIDQAYIRVMKPRPLNKEKAISAVKQVGEGAGSAVKLARSVNVTKHIPVKKDTPKEEEAKDDDDDEKSDSGSESDDSSAGSNDDDFDFDDSVVSPEWKTKSTLRLSDVTLKKRDKDTCTLIVRDRNNKEKTKEFAFEDEKAAIDFESKINKQASLGPERDEDRFKAVLGSTEMKDEKEPLGLLVEIIGGVDLPILDMTSSDPYVVAKFDREVIHKTVHLPKSLNPIWTIKTGSMFVFDVRAKELFQNYEGLCLEVLDYDAYGGHDVMGIVKIPPKFLYSASEEREEFPLRPLKAKGANSNVSGKLAIRCRKATNYDKEFLEEYNEYQKQKKKKDPVKLKAGFKVLKQAGKGGTDIVKNTVAVQVKKKEKVDGNTVVKYKVRPEPDPERVSTTTWMTKEDVLLESMKESRVWADAGSGTLAKVYVEVLSCTGLPNMDMGVNLNNKTDSFCKIVYEDCMCETDVIDDCLSPCWMPWSNRAFILHTQHTSSPLFIGVFDYDSGLNDRLDGHDPIGRVSVDMSNLRADTVYVLHYQLWTEEKIIADRKPNGTLKIRLRLEVPDKRELVFSSLQPYHNVYVNTKQNKEYKCAKYVAKGPDEEKFSTDTLKAYQAELMAYLDLIVYIKDALINLLLWRGTFKVSLTKSKSVMLPLHSLTLFIAGVTLVENPYLLPSYSCGSIAWLLLAVMDFRLSNPDPWDRCKSFREMVEIIIAGQPLGTTTIAENENSEEAAAFRKKWEDKIEEMQRKAIEAKEKKAKEAAEEEEITGEEEEELETKDSSISINPLKPILYPLQKILCVVLEYVRFIKNIIFWEECYYAFWTTSASIIFAVFFLFIPWKFIMVWSARIVVWAVLGPWMRLVDIFFYRKIESMTKEEAKKREKAMKEAREVYLEKLRRDKRIKQEETTKMKEIKKYMFGKYSTNVPVLKTDRFRDVPLPASTASPYTPEEYSTAQLAMEEAGSNLKRLEGQNVQGVMIPRQVDGVEKVTKGQKVSSTRKLKKGSLAAKVLGAEAEKSAIPKIGKVMLVATVAAWAGFPVIKSVAQSTATQVMSFF